MSKSLIERLLSHEAEELPSNAVPEAFSQLRDPTLDERARLYLRAVQGKQDFGNEEFSNARSLILDAMAAEITEETGYKQTLVPRHIPQVPVFAAAHAPDVDEYSAMLSELSPLPTKMRESEVGSDRVNLKKIEFLEAPDFRGGRGRPLFRFSSRTIKNVCVGAAAIVCVGVFALLRNNELGTSSAWFYLPQKSAEQQVAVNSSQKQSKATLATPTQMEPFALEPGFAAASGSPAEKLSREDLIAGQPPLTKTVRTTRVAPKDEQLASNFPPQVEPLLAASNFPLQVADQAAPSRSSTKQLSPKELAVLEKLAQQMIVSAKTVALLKGEPPKRQEGLADLVKRGRELISAGKIGNARVLLRIAADVNDGAAAFALATTYDPAVLGKLNNHDSDPDITTALVWYRKASDLGSAEAWAWLMAAEDKSGPQK